jgi:2-amino-4-hydroxy-6-hydroxymethyldihydropteridine diphosphokinase
MHPSRPHDPHTLVRAYIGLGSNLSDPVRQVQAALSALASLPDTKRVAHSRLYRSPPLGPPGQPDYINAVAALDTRLTAHELLGELQTLEQRQGRVCTGERWGPRVIDLDILLYADSVLHTRHLTLPHPGLAERDFVLWPLAELAPGLEVAGLGPLEALMSRCPQRGLVLVDALEQQDEVVRSLA